MYEYSNIYNSYDHRLKNIIIKSKDPSLFSELGIPTSTISTWINNDINKNIVTLDLLDNEKDILILKMLSLEKDNKKLRAQMELIEKVNKIFRISKRWIRLPVAEEKKKIITLIEKTSKLTSLKKCLDLVDITVSRFKD